MSAMKEALNKYLNEWVTEHKAKVWGITQGYEKMLSISESTN